MTTTSYLSEGAARHVVGRVRTIRQRTALDVDVRSMMDDRTTGDGTGRRGTDVDGAPAVDGREVRATLRGAQDELAADLSRRGSVVRTPQGAPMGGVSYPIGWTHDTRRERPSRFVVGTDATTVDVLDLVGPWTSAPWTYLPPSTFGRVRSATNGAKGGRPVARLVSCRERDGKVAREDTCGTCVTCRNRRSRDRKRDERTTLADSRAVQQATDAAARAKLGNVNVIE